MYEERKGNRNDNFTLIQGWFITWTIVKRSLGSIFNNPFINSLAVKISTTGKSSMAKGTQEANNNKKHKYDQK